MNPESIRICAICGKREEEEEEFGRCLCQRIVCSECWDFDAGKCKVCTEEEKKGFEKPDVDLGESTLILKRGTKKKPQPEDLFGAKKKKKHEEEEEKEAVQEEPQVEQKDIKTQMEEQKEEIEHKVVGKPAILEVKKEPEAIPEVAHEVDTEAIVEAVLAQVMTKIPKTEAVDLSPFKGKIETLDKRIEELECAKNKSSYENDLALLKDDFEKIKSELKAFDDKIKGLDAKEVGEDQKAEIKKIARQYIEEKMQQEIPERLEVITYKTKEDILEQVNAKLAGVSSQSNLEDVKTMIINARNEIETEMNSRLAPLVDLIEFKNNLNIGAEIDKLREEYKKELELRLEDVVKQIKTPQVLEELISLVDSAELIKKRSSEGWTVISSSVIGDKLSLTFRKQA